MSDAEIIKDLRNKNKTLREELFTAQSALCCIESLNITSENAEAVMKQHPGLTLAIGAAFANLVVEAPNYVEMEYLPAYEPDSGEKIVVLVRKVSGKTPHELRKDAEAERDAIIAAAENVVRMVQKEQLACLLPWRIVSEFQESIGNLENAIEAAKGE